VPLPPDGGVGRRTGYRSLSFWHDAPDLDWTPSDALTGPRNVDVAIVGGGYTGLWTAYYLAKADPSLRIAVLEREVIGIYGHRGTQRHDF